MSKNKSTSLEEKNKITTLRNVIQEGINSGIAHNFIPVEHLKTLRARKQSNE